MAGNIIPRPFGSRGVISTRATTNTRAVSHLPLPWGSLSQRQGRVLSHGSERAQESARGLMSKHAIRERFCV